MNLEEMQSRRKILADQESDLLAQLADSAPDTESSGARPQHQLIARLAVTHSAAAAYDVMIASAIVAASRPGTATTGPIA